MTIPRSCQCCAACPDCAHHDAWYDEYGSGNEITTAADRKRHAYMQSIGDFDPQTNSCKSGRCLATCIDLLCAMRRGEDIAVGGG